MDAVPVDWAFTKHAVDRALDMALDPGEISSILSRPHVTQPTGNGYEDGYEIWAADKVALVVHPAKRLVITCLWRGMVYVRGDNSEPFRDN